MQLPALETMYFEAISSDHVTDLLDFGATFLSTIVTLHLRLRTSYGDLTRFFDAMPSLLYLDVMRYPFLAFEALASAQNLCANLTTLGMDTSPVHVKAFLQKRSTFTPSNSISTLKFKRRIDLWEFSREERTWLLQNYSVEVWDGYRWPEWTTFSVP
jgi:hypothetical protein